MTKLERRDPVSESQIADNNAAVFIMGCEFGFKCREKNMNLELALAEAQRIVGATDKDRCICARNAVFVNPQCKEAEHVK